jgi:hypothetical protein
MLLPAGIPASFVTSGNSPSLYLGLSIYDNTDSDPELVYGPVLMDNFIGNAYQGKFTPEAGKTYLAFMAVYTDASLENLDDDYQQDVQAFTSMTLTQSIQSVMGSIDCGSSFPSLFTFKIFKGDEKTIYLKAVNAGCSSDPLDLSECTEISIHLPNADGSQTILKLSDDEVQITSPSVLGKFSALIAEEVSALLNVGVRQNIDVTFTIAGQVFTVAFLEALSVFEAP